MGIMSTFLRTVLSFSLALAVPFSQPITFSELSRVTRDHPPINYRLPKNIVPIFYEIMLNPDLDGEQFTFYGESKINIRVEESTNVITLHAKNLEIKPGVTIKCDLTNDVEVSIIEPIDITTDFLKIILGKELQAGSNCNLTLSYAGKNGKHYKGIYRTSYKTGDGEKKWLVSNSFHPMGARQAFPCWDEPALKAKFTISIEHGKNYIALSNMDVTKEEMNPMDSNRIITHFAQSPKMSIYLVALTIGDVVKVDSDNSEFRVWAPNNLVGKIRYASKVGPKIIEALEKYTNYPYHAHGFKKMDSIAVDLPYHLNAIEDWGLVRYRQRCLYFDEISDSTAQKERVTKIMAHELAHQWFGNLVTADWYDFIWLNEGFANYFQYAIPDEIEPTWRIMDRYVLENIQSGAFIHDSKRNIHAMEQKRTSPVAVENAYDAITYKKSGSIIRMIWHVIGETKFKSSMRNYLRSKAYSTATSDDLFKEFAIVDTSNTNLLKILKSWVTTPGYPVITVTRDYESRKATITQSRFLDEIGATTTETYWIPMNFVTENNMNFADTSVTHWFDPTEHSMVIEELESDQFVIFNKQLSGYYRVNYDTKNWDLIINYMKSDKFTNIHVLNRAQLIDDAFNLAKVGHLNYNVVLSLIGYLKKETDFIPWSAAWKVIEYIHNFVENTQFDKQFKNYVLELSENLVNGVLSIQLDQADYITELKRLDTLKNACLYGSSSCKSYATNKLIKWLDDSEINALSPDDQHWLICAGTQNANQTTWDRLKERFSRTRNKSILVALGCSSNIAILKNFLFNSITKTPTYLQLPLLFLIIHEGSSNGATAILEFIIENYNNIIALDQYSSDQFQNELTTLGQRLTSEAQYKKLQQFIESNKVSLNGAGDEALKAAQNNLNATENKRLNEFEEFFNKKATEPSDDPTKINTKKESSVINGE